MPPSSKLSWKDIKLMSIALLFEQFCLVGNIIAKIQIFVFWDKSCLTIIKETAMCSLYDLTFQRLANDSNCLLMSKLNIFLSLVI
jgi:hypothetical protein